MHRRLPTFARDHRMGMKAEKKYKITAKKKYNLELTKLPKYYFADFVNHEKKLMIELKRRNNMKNRYKYTLIGYDKLQRFIEFNEQNGNRYVFLMVFHFNDGIYFFEHLDGYEYDVRKYVRRKRADYNDKPKDYIFIPVNQLEPMDNIRRYTDNNLIIRYNIR